MKPITLKHDQKLTIEQAIMLFGENFDFEQRLNLKTVGPWNIIYSINGLVVKTNFSTKELTIHGYRTMFDCRQSGYEIEGRVSIGGKKYSCFTSSELFELEDGRLIDVGIIFPRIKE